MRPSKRHMKVDRYVDPSEFEKWKKVAEDMGFLYVASGPLVRSSYKVRPSPLFQIAQKLTCLLYGFRLESSSSATS